MTLNEAAVHALYDSLPAAAYICDADGLITYYNHYAEVVWGRAPRLNDPTDRFCGSFRLFSAAGDPIPHDECWMALALKNGREYQGQEIVIERQDGVRLTALAHAKPLRDEAGRVIGAVNVVIDITGRKRAEESQAYLAAIVESSDQAIISKSLDGVIQSWNAGAERLFGYTAEEVIGKPVTIVIPLDRRHEEDDILSRLRRGERIEHYETVRRTKDGRLIDVSLTISPVRDSSGRLIAASKIAHDITARKLADRQLREMKDLLASQLVEVQESDRRKEEFLATLAHELRNPLAPIGNSLHILRLSGDLSPSAERIRDIIERQFNHMVRLVDDLLEVSRITRGKIELRRERVDLAAIVRGAVETSTPLIESFGHQLAISLPTEPVFLDADPIRLAQVLSNLLNNAAKYTEKGGQIWLQARSEGSEVVLVVKDNGVGIPPEMLARVFEMFSQVDRTLQRSQGGLGIGLTLARKLVELHGGRLTAHSAGVGQGSEFVICLPLVPPQLPDAPLIADSNVVVTAIRRRILVVDDAQAAAFTLSKLLEKLGHTVVTATDGAAALQTVLNEHPDVVISDIGMPTMDGYQLARIVRSNPALADTVLVALSGYGQESDRRQAMEAGFDRHLVKPVSVAALRDVLASLPTPNGNCRS